jgi:hypothetical protein
LIIFFLTTQFEIPAYHNMADSMATNAPIGVVQALNDRLDAVTKLLEPLLSAPLSETVGKLSVLERCQLHILLSYTLNTTIFSKS